MFVSRKITTLIISSRDKKLTANNIFKPLYNESQKKLETIETEMLELRLYTTKQSIEHELARKDDIDGLSLETQTISATTTTSSMAIGQQHDSSSLDKLRQENELLRSQVTTAQQLSQNERVFFESRLQEKDSELVELERQTSALKRKYQKMCEQVQDVERACDEYKVKIH